MKTAQLWFTVPQAVVLEATGDLEAVLNLTDDDLDLLVIKANKLLSAFTVIPLEADADEERRRDTFRKFHEAKTTRTADSRYSQAQERVRERLVAGVTTTAGRTPGGPSEDVALRNSQGSNSGVLMRSTREPRPSACATCVSTGTSTSKA